MKDPLKTVLFGFGKIGHEMALDPVMAKYFTYSTHAQVLKDHPRFSWEAVVDPSGEALDAAKYKWNIPVLASSVDELVESFQPEVAVIATPPNQRINIIDRFPDLKAVFVEKPLAMNTHEGNELVRLAHESGKVLFSGRLVKEKSLDQNNVYQIKSLAENELMKNDKMIFSVQVTPKTKYADYIKVLDYLKAAKATKISIAN